MTRSECPPIDCSTNPTTTVYHISQSTTAMDPALAATLHPNYNPPNTNNAPPQFNAPAAAPQFNPPNPSYPQSNASSQPTPSQPLSNPSAPPSSYGSYPLLNSPSPNSPTDTTFNMNLGGPGGISTSSGPRSNHTSLGGPNGINISHGPNGSYTSLGGPNGIIFQGAPFGDSDDDDDDDDYDGFWQIGINNNNKNNNNFGTGNTINGLPFPGISINSNNNMNNVYGGNNVPGANYGNNNGNNWGAVHPSLRPDHVRKDYEEGMAAGQRAIDEAFGAMSGMGMGPWGMGWWSRPPKQMKTKGSKGKKR